MNGSITVSPTQTTTYILTARNSVNDDDVDGYGYRRLATPGSAGVRAARRRPRTSAQASRRRFPGPASMPTTVSITPGVGSVAKSGSVSVNPSQTTTYTVTAVGGGASATCNITVTVSARSGDRELHGDSGEHHRRAEFHLAVERAELDFGEHQLDRDGCGQRDAQRFAHGHDHLHADGDQRGGQCDHARLRSRWAAAARSSCSPATSSTPRFGMCSWMRPARSARRATLRCSSTGRCATIRR